MDQFSPTSRPQGSKVICTENNATTRTTRSGSRVTPLNGLSPRRNHHKSPRHSPSTLNGNLIKASWPSPGHNSNSFTMRPASFNPSPDKLTSNPYSASQTLSFNNSSATDALDHGNAILRNGLLSGLHSSSFSRNIFSPDHSSSPLDTVEAMDIDHQDDEVPITLDHRTPTSENSKSVMSSGATVSGNTISVDSTAESSVSTFSTSSAETKSKRRSVAAGEQVDFNACTHIIIVMYSRHLGWENFAFPLGRFKDDDQLIFKFLKLINLFTLIMYYSKSKRKILSTGFKICSYELPAIAGSFRTLPVVFISTTFIKIIIIFIWKKLFSLS